MNLNIIAYCIYIAVIFYVTVFIGKKFHSNGRIFLHELVADHGVCEAVNNILLVAYYLLNIGNAIVMIRTWPQIQSIGELVEVTSYNIGLIVLLLVIVHYVNIVLLLLGRLFINKLSLKR